jgi:heme/copper-type cytochrome/quinol oxidase subunit 4
MKNTDAIANLRKYILGGAIFDFVASILVVLVIARVFKLDIKVTLIILLGIIPAGLLFHTVFLMYYDNDRIKMGVIIISSIFLLFSVYTRMQFYASREKSNVS